MNGFAPIYIGDTVKVSERWASDKGQNPHLGKSGIVTKLESGLQSCFNIEYLIFGIRQKEGNYFETYYYALDRIYQTDSNKLVEKLLREKSDNITKSLYSRKKS